MTNIRPAQLTLSAIGLLLCLTNLAAQSAPAAADGLARLTVPTPRLPKNCQLEPVGKDANGRPKFVMYPGRLDANPWIGTRQPTVALIRQFVEGTPADLPQGPAGLDQSALGTVDGYIAQYVTPDGGKVAVYAVRFNSPELTARAAVRRLSGEVPSIVFGSTAARINWSPPTARVPSTNIETCYRAVRDYIAALK